MARDKTLTPFVISSDYGPNFSHDSHNGAQEAGPKDVDSRSGRREEDCERKERPNQKPIPGALLARITYNAESLRIVL